jgi:peroxiredoxin
MYEHERSLVKKLKDKPFVLLGVNSDPSADALKAVIKRESMTWPSFVDGGTDGPIATQWGIQGWPTIFVIDAQGIIRYRDVRDQQLERAVETLLSEMK